MPSIDTVGDRQHMFTPCDPFSVTESILIGEGPFEVRLAVTDLNQTRAFLTQHGVSFAPAPMDTDALLLSSEQAAGARLVLVQQSQT